MNKKNSQIHLMIESAIFERLKQEASQDKISLSEYCRRRLGENSQLDRIEVLLNQLIEHE